MSERQVFGDMNVFLNSDTTMPVYGDSRVGFREIPIFTEPTAISSQGEKGPFWDYRCRFIRTASFAVSFSGMHRRLGICVLWNEPAVEEMLKKYRYDWCIRTKCSYVQL